MIFIYFCSYTEEVKSIIFMNTCIFTGKVAPFSTMRHYLFLLAWMLCCSCGTEYYDIDTDEITTPEGIDGHIPQEGTTLFLDVSYKLDVHTKFQPGSDYRFYRYHVLVNEWEYSSGILFDGSQSVSIPIMENDTHAPVSIVVEGAKAMDYSDSPSSWDDWHELYRGTQEGLPDAEPTQYDALAGAKLGIDINGKSFFFDIHESGAGIAFKRLLSRLRRITVPVTIDSFITTYEFPDDMGKTIPANQDHNGSGWKAGNVYLHHGWLYICLHDKNIHHSYPTLLGSVVSNDRKALKALYPGRNGQEQAEMTLYLK